MRARSALLGVLPVVAGALAAATSPSAATGGSVVRVTARPDGSQTVADSLGARLLDGGRVAIHTYAQFDPAATVSELWLRDPATGESVNATQGPAGEGIAEGLAYWPGVSRDGRYVAFSARLAGVASPRIEMYRRDVLTGVTTLLSGASAGAYNYPFRHNPTSADGRYTVWNDGTPAMSVHDAAAGAVRTVVAPRPVDPFAMGADTDGNVYVSGRRSPASRMDGYVIDSATGAVRASVTEADWVTFATDAGLLLAQHPRRLDVVAWRTGSVTAVAIPDDIRSPVVSEAGRWLAYGSARDPWDTVVAAWRQTWLVDLATGDRFVVSRDAGGAFAGHHADPADVTPDGRVLVNTSAALVASDTNGLFDAYVATRGDVPYVSAPVVSALLDRPPNGHGWYAAPVTITWRVAPPSLGAPPSQVAATDGTVHYVSSAVCTAPGRCATGRVAVSLDRAAPAAQVTPAQTVAPDGWVNGDARDAGPAGIATVTVTFTARGVAQVVRVAACEFGAPSCFVHVRAPSEPGVHLATITVTDLAGNRTTGAPMPVVVTP